MKRRRGRQGDHGMIATKKKARGVLEKRGGEESDGREGVVAAAAEEDETVMLDLEEWPWLRWKGVVDEQMSWGTLWCPFWDIDFLGEAYDADVVWDDDIWGLKGITEIPRIKICENSNSSLRPSIGISYTDDRLRPAEMVLPEKFSYSSAELRYLLQKGAMRVPDRGV
ncbi:hypothetical protein RJ639_013632 [Escallonia herrerae]|uniref:Uncharacterized protein n=1 Tax=Escallonia herrerae TaxID=1293975 RepID=A0AA89ANI9_9ASTE|nr:hypothetical protein RJ639_013632 [Escallonia herrerae]